MEQDDSWQDFHHRFMTYTAATLTSLVGDGYLVKIEVRLYLHELSAEERRYFSSADAGIITRRLEPISTGKMIGSAAPVQLKLPAVEVERHSSLEIRDRRKRRLVTTIEFLSPTNKSAGPNRDDYLSKRAQFFASDVNFVEIDLLRGGTRPRPPDLPKCDYYVLVSRADALPDMGMWPIGIRERLPKIPIPLAAPDTDAMLDLQNVFNQAYDAANYGNYIHSETPQPPLSIDDEAWAKELIAGMPNGKLS